MSRKAAAGNTSSGDSDTDDKNLMQVMSPPPFMTAVMRRQLLRGLVKSLPEKVQNRIVALKNIQIEQLQLEAAFFEEVYNLERKYSEKYQPLFDKRSEIIAGTVDPPNQTPQWKEPEEADVSDKLEGIFLGMKASRPAIDNDVSGIPDFWLTIFRNTEILSEMVQEHDEPLLRKLRDIKVKYEKGLEHSYTLEFYFDKNEHFSNPILTKRYFLKVALDEEYPFAFEGPEIYKCEGCDIKWEKGMNLTVKTIRKKQKHKERGAVRTITRQVPNDTFFNFFNPPDERSEQDEETQGILAADFEIGHFIRARLIPKAVLYYSGDIVDDEDDDCDEYDEEEEEDDDDDDDGDGDVVKPVKNAKGKNAANPNDCPNQ